MANRVFTLPATTSAAAWRDLLKSYDEPLWLSRGAVPTREEIVSPIIMRDEHLHRYGYFILTSEVVALIAERFKDMRAVEVGAGKGYLSSHLRQAGMAITATDSGEWAMGENYCDIRRLDAAAAIEDDHQLVVLTWPPYEESMGFRALEKVRVGQYFLYQGEGSGGCCAEEAFFDLLHSDAFEEDEAFSRSLNSNHARFRGMHDHWGLYRRVK